MHIGLIGGIGPAATVVYYQALVAQMRRKAAPLELTIVQAQASDLVRNNREGNVNAQAAIYADLIDRLRDAGADCAAITSIGGHFCFAETRERASLPLVSAIAPLDAYFASQGLSKIGLLGTVRAMETKLYGALAQTQAVVPEANLAEVGQTYTDTAVSGTCSSEQRALFFEAGRRMVEDQGAQAIILAGTDLGLAFHGQDPGYKWIDALDVHVDLLARLAADEVSLAEVAA